MSAACDSWTPVHSLDDAEQVHYLRRRVAELVAELERVKNGDGRIPYDDLLAANRSLSSRVRELQAENERLRMMLSAPMITRSTTGRLVPESHPTMAPPDCTVPDVVEATAHVLGLTVDDMRYRSRAPRYSHARWICGYVLRRLFGYSYPELAAEFGLRSHSTFVGGLQHMTDNRNRVCASDPDGRTWRRIVSDVYDRLGVRYDPAGVLATR